MLDLSKTPVMQFSKKLVHLKHIQLLFQEIKTGDRKIYLKQGFLYQSYLLHLVSYWQVFIEDLMRYGVELQAKKQIIPPEEVAARKIFVEDKITQFRNPTCKAVDKLVRDCFQLEKLSSCWLWEKWPRDKVLQVLDGIIKVRHSVAHTGYSSVPLTIRLEFLRKWRS